MPKTRQTIKIETMQASISIKGRIAKHIAQMETLEHCSENWSIEIHQEVKTKI